MPLGKNVNRMLVEGHESILDETLSNFFISTFRLTRRVRMYSCKGVVAILSTLHGYIFTRCGRRVVHTPCLISYTNLTKLPTQHLSVENSYKL